MNMKMNKFVCAVAFVILASTTFAAPDAKFDEFRNKFMSSTGKCAVTVEFTEKDTKDLYQIKSNVSTKIGCFVSCLGKELDLVNDKNLFDKEKIFKLADMLQGNEPVPKEEYEKNKEITETCLDAQKADTDPCVIGKNLAQCMISAVLKAGYKIFK